MCVSGSGAICQNGGHVHRWRVGDNFRVIIHSRGGQIGGKRSITERHLVEINIKSHLMSTLFSAD